MLCFCYVLSCSVVLCSVGRYGNVTVNAKDILAIPTDVVTRGSETSRRGCEVERRFHPDWLIHHLLKTYVLMKTYVNENLLTSGISSDMVVSAFVESVCYNERNRHPRTGDCNHPGLHGGSPLHPGEASEEKPATGECGSRHCGRSPDQGQSASADCRRGKGEWATPAGKGCGKSTAPLVHRIPRSIRSVHGPVHLAAVCRDL